ncbi:hypothetical protein ACFLQJ_03105, partial [Calditrichota bacterium]
MSINTKFVGLFLIVFIITGSISESQVNTESLRKGYLTDGFHADVNLDAGIVSGNSDLLQIKTSLRADYVRGKSHAFVITSYKQGRHHYDTTHYIPRLAGKLYAEGFFQKEFDEFILLEDRNLIGGGFRIPWGRKTNNDNKIANLKAFTGIGLMWEQERIKADD